MSRKIATPTSVFAACDKLDATGRNWNRDDVRAAVGGGGFTVIDPLIRAWRKLKPLKELAPSTPTELLHLVAESLESHYGDFRREIEERATEQQQVFTTTATELSAQIAGQDEDLQVRETAIQTLELDCAKLTETLDETKLALREAHEQNRQLQSANDELRGQANRRENEYNAALQKQQEELKTLELRHEQSLSDLIKEHKAELRAQRKEMAEAGELAENRLMRLLDQERQDAKTAANETSQLLGEVRENEKAQKEENLQLQTQVHRLEEKLAQLTQDNDQLKEDLSGEKVRYAALQEDFQQYQSKHSADGKLEELHASILAIQQQISDEGS